MRWRDFVSGRPFTYGISGKVQNSFEGILISGLGATGNVVLGNFIGTNASGANLGNVGDGVLIDASNNNTIGGANTIGHNGTISSIGGAVGAGIQISLALASWCATRGRMHKIGG